MDIIFNKDDSGQEEIKHLLGFLDADITFKNLQTDIKLNTPELVDFIGESMYNLALTHYKKSEDDEALNDIVEHIQLFIIIKAYLDYAPNADLSHSNSGRKFTTDENEKIPWDWQLKADNKALKSRCYKALDRLILLLNKSDLQEWKESVNFKKSSELFIKNTKEFDDIYNINKSHQLYFRLIPHLKSVQEKEIIPIIGGEKYEELKALIKNTNTINKANAALIIHIRNAIVHLALSKAYDLFPVEMFPEHLQYTESNAVKAKVREEVSQRINKIGNDSLDDLIQEYAKQTATYSEIDPLQHLKENQNYIHL